MKNSSITLSQAISAYLLEAQARRLSTHTIADYTNTFRKLSEFLEHPERSGAESKDPPLASITADHIVAFFAGLARPSAPDGIAPRAARPIGRKQILNHHTGLSALWTWATREGYITEHIMRHVPRPRPERPAITPLSQADVKALLAVCDRSAPYARPGQRPADYSRPSAVRDRAILLILLDTGVRASELSDLRLRHIDLRNAAITVTGKGAKTRRLPLGPIAAKALTRHIYINRADAGANDPVFLGRFGAAMNRDALLKLIYRLGERAGVPDVHPHRFRHTFAIEYLRNGGNTRALQEALGHETLDMIRTYTRIAEADLANGHRIASPVEHWRL